jgi:hypothetical protein
MQIMWKYVWYKVSRWIALTCHYYDERTKKGHTIEGAKAVAIVSN